MEARLLWQLPAVAGAVAGIVLATAAARRLRPATVLASGLLGSAAGFVLLGTVGPDSGALDLVAGCMLVGAGTGAVAARAIDVVVAGAPPQRAGAAAGLGETRAELGGALGIAVLGSVMATVHRGATPDRPVALPASGEVLTAAGRQVYAAGFAAAAQVAAALLVGGALVVMASLRGRARRPAPRSTARDRDGHRGTGTRPT